MESVSRSVPATVSDSVGGSAEEGLRPRGRGKRKTMSQEFEEHEAIGLVHETLSGGNTIVYNPDYPGDAPTEWIRSDTYVEIGDL